MKQTDLAWAAGFIDGGGCFYVQKLPTRAYMRLAVDQADEVPGKPATVLKRVQEVVGGSFQSRPQRGTRRAQHKLIVNREERVHAAAKKLWKYLGPVKREQYLEAKRKCSI